MYIKNNLKPALVAFSVVPLVANIYLPLNLGSATIYPIIQEKVVTVSIEGMEGKKVFETRANNLRDAFSDGGVEVTEFDLVRPGLDYELTTSVVEASITKARKVTIYDGNELILGMSPYLSAEDILDGLEIKIYKEDFVKVANPLEGLVLSPIIYIDRAPIINLQVDGELKEIYARLNTVEDLLATEGIVLGEKDRVEPSLETQLKNNIKVSVIRVSESENTETVDIPFSIIYKDDANMIKGETKVEQFGKVGKKEIKFKKIIEDGKEVKKVTLEEKIIEPAIDQVIIRGTKTFATGAYSDYMNDAAKKYGVDAAKMSRLMYCESHGNPNAVSGNGLYHGLFQYASGTWAGASAQAGWGGYSVYNPKAQIYTTAWKISIQGYRAWPYCGN